IGLYPDVEATLDVDLATLKAGMIVADVIPNPPRTRLIRDAEQRGCRVLDGLGMLVNQGVIGIKYWTGVDADPGVMRRTIQDLLGTACPPWHGLTSSGQPDPCTRSQSATANGLPKPCVQSRIRGELAPAGAMPRAREGNCGCPFGQWCFLCGRA